MNVVIVVGSTNDAIRQFGEAQKSNDIKPNVLIADNRLPDGYGIDAAAKMLKIDPSLNVILATADSISDETDDVAREVGIQTILRKPFSMRKLVSAINSEESSFNQVKEGCHENKKRENKS